MVRRVGPQDRGAYRAQRVRDTVIAVTGRWRGGFGRAEGGVAQQVVHRGVPGHQDDAFGGSAVRAEPVRRCVQRVGVGPALGRHQRVQNRCGVRQPVGRLLRCGGVVGRRPGDGEPVTTADAFQGLGQALLEIFQAPGFVGLAVQDKDAVGGSEGAAGPAEVDGSFGARVLDGPGLRRAVRAAVGPCAFGDGVRWWRPAGWCVRTAGSGSGRRGWWGCGLRRRARRSILPMRRDG